MKTLFHRIYSDYLMPSRLGSYERLLQAAADQGYRQLSVRDFLRPTRAATRTLVHRHDIDSDVRTAAKMFAIEAKIGITASYYFRLSTLDFGLMRDIEAYGSEASYHYEEAASYAKAQRIRSASVLRSRFPLIREQFAHNLSHIESTLERKLTTVASHGDFANRRLQVYNHELLADPALRLRCGIVCETYDADLLEKFDQYISDRPYPQHFHPISPRTALGRFHSICLLTHPVQWETNWRETTRCNVRRAAEGLAW
ncbi:MAG: hypothetical protein ACJ8GW_10250 [Massilia sp.]